MTTSHYGRDSREFAKDKPITLIDGENLVHMFQKHGRSVQHAMSAQRRSAGFVTGKEPAAWRSSTRWDGLAARQPPAVLCGYFSSHLNAQG